MGQIQLWCRWAKCHWNHLSCNTRAEFDLIFFEHDAKWLQKQCSFYSSANECGGFILAPGGHVFRAQKNHTVWHSLWLLFRKDPGLECSGRCRSWAKETKQDSRMDIAAHCLPLANLLPALVSSFSSFTLMFQEQQQQFELFWSLSGCALFLPRAYWKATL